MASNTHILAPPFAESDIGCDYDHDEANGRGTRDAYQKTQEREDSEDAVQDGDRKMVGSSNGNRYGTCEAGGFQDQGSGMEEDIEEELSLSDLAGHRAEARSTTAYTTPPMGLSPLSPSPNFESADMMRKEASSPVSSPLSPSQSPSPSPSSSSSSSSTTTSPTSSSTTLWLSQNTSTQRDRDPKGHGMGKKRLGDMGESLPSLDSSMSSFGSSSPMFPTKLHKQAKLKGRNAPPTPMRERRTLARASFPNIRRRPPVSSSALTAASASASMLFNRPDCLRANSLATIYTATSAGTTSNHSPYSTSHSRTNHSRTNHSHTNIHEHKLMGILRQGRFHHTFTEDRSISVSENRVTFDIPDDFSIISYKEEDSINLSDCEDELYEPRHRIQEPDSEDHNQSGSQLDNSSIRSLASNVSKNNRNQNSGSAGSDLYNMFHKSMATETSEQFLEFLHTSSDSILSTVSSIEIECDSHPDDLAFHQSLSNLSVGNDGTGQETGD